MNLFHQLWKDEQGAILTAEAVMIGSVAVLGGVVGLNAAASAVNDEMTEMASAIRSLDQSYVIRGHSRCGAWTAGSYYIQPRVEESLAELCGEQPTDVVKIRDEIDAQRAKLYPTITEEPAPANELPPKKKDKKKAEAKKPAKDSQED
ncbi:hypothetical protein GC163_10830 [bacterium]|nr:hypothetical protein [bacterium]